MQLTNKHGTEIRTVADWYRLAPPKRRDTQWRGGRSAAELAGAWCWTGEPQVPPVLLQLLATHPDTAGCVVLKGIPEMPIIFDQHGGEPRNADLALTAELNGSVVAITVEAKADETFGQYTGIVLADAIDREFTSRSRGVDRVRGLAAALLPPPKVRGRTLALSEIRYQLLTAAAGSLKWAAENHSSRAVLLIDEYVTDRTEDELHAANARDLAVFVRRLSRGADTSCPPGQLLGPYEVPGKPLFDKPAKLYVGKTVTNVRSGRRRHVSAGPVRD